MRTHRIICVVLAATAVLATPLCGQTQNGVNPALRYYQAFLLAPDVTGADMDYLASNNLWSVTLPEHFGEIVSRYDAEFRILRQTLDSRASCDWGLDLSQGPATLLPHLARCKAVMVVARYRVAWHLQQNHQADARDDLLAAFTLARNVSRDGTLISVLVQIAAESIGCDIIAENYARFSPEVLQQLVQGIDAAPPRGTVSASIFFERTAFHDWLIRKIQQLQAVNPGDDAKVMSETRQFVLGMQGTEPSEDNSTQVSLWDRLRQAGGNTSEGIIQCLKAESHLYDRLAEVLALPPSEFDDAVKKFSTEIQPMEAGLLADGLPAFIKARHREFRAGVWLAMIHAALAYRLHGDPGLLAVNDPGGQGPFAFRRFFLNGVDRGFQLKSELEASGFPETLIFVERGGVPFFLDGPHAGEARALPAPQK